MRHSKRIVFVPIVVLAVVSIIVSLGVPIHYKSRLRSKEAILNQNLFTLRTVIREYTHDKGKAPQTLDELAAAGYLRQLPLDPMTGSERGWIVVRENSADHVESGIVDVRSGSDKISLKGTPYSEW